MSRGGGGLLAVGLIVLVLLVIAIVLVDLILSAIPEDVRIPSLKELLCGSTVGLAGLSVLGLMTLAHRGVVPNSDDSVMGEPSCPHHRVTPLLERWHADGPRPFRCEDCGEIVDVRP